MSDRHQELRRQYELVRSHLTWLEKEIAREEALSAAQPWENTQVARNPETMPPTTPVSTSDIEALLSNYAETERHDPKAVKKGCILAFAIVMGLIVVAVTAVYFGFYAHR